MSIIPEERRQNQGMTDSVICARNENASTFIPVIRALKKVGQPVFVDDGNNKGVWRARIAGAKIVRTPGSQGKAAAMRYGLGQVKTQRVIFADADLTGFNRYHARRLADASSGMIIGFRDNGSKWLAPFPAISGERSLPTAYAWEALRDADGYEAETAINSFIGNLGLPVETFIMNGVRNPRKTPLSRARQVFRAAVRHLPGLFLYLISFLKGTVAFSV